MSQPVIITFQHDLDDATIALIDKLLSEVGEVLRNTNFGEPDTVIHFTPTTVDIIKRQSDLVRIFSTHHRMVGVLKIMYKEMEKLLDKKKMSQEEKLSFVALKRLIEQAEG